MIFKFNKFLLSKINENLKIKTCINFIYIFCCSCCYYGVKLSKNINLIPSINVCLTLNRIINKTFPFASWNFSSCFYKNIFTNRNVKQNCIIVKYFPLPYRIFQHRFIAMCIKQIYKQQRKKKTLHLYLYITRWLNVTTQFSIEIFNNVQFFIAFSLAIYISRNNEKINCCKKKLRFPLLLVYLCKWGN